MPKKLMVTVGYTDYVGDEEDVLRLLGIASRMTRVKHITGREYDQVTRDETADPFVSAARLVNFIETVEAEFPEVEPAPQSTALTPPQSDPLF